MISINKKSGIYRIHCLITGDCYVGQSINLGQRKQDHIHNLLYNKHDNIHLQRAYNKYGKENFTFEVLCLCEPFELTRLEKEFKEKLNAKYNIRLCTDSNKGIKHSEEFRDKQRELHLGKCYRKNWYPTEEQKLHHSLIMKGKTSPNKGKKLSDEHKKKISLSRIGYKCSDDVREKMSKSATIAWSKRKNQCVSA